MVLVNGVFKWYWCLQIAFIGFAVLSVAGDVKGKYIMQYKNELVTELLKQQFEDVTREEILDGDLRDYGDKMYSCHRFEGKYKGVDFVFSDIKLICIKVKNKEKAEKEIFKRKSLKQHPLTLDYGLKGGGIVLGFFDCNSSHD